MEKSVVQTSDGLRFDLHKCHTIVVGSGAAGLTCAERLFNSGIEDVVILTSNLYGGTSYGSGSDKQTYYKMSLFGDTQDSPMQMAHSLFDGGCMDGDLAYIESLYSLPGFFHLVENGVPFPFNSYGAFVGYKTDHDPRQRATSAGPKTSRFMVETSLVKVRKLGIPILEGMTVVKLATVNGAICGVVAIDGSKVDDENMGITLFSAQNVVLATGGPGELYSSSVYPRGQVSMHGVALDAGVDAVNLGESQFGITSTKFRWNLSGTYQQVVPSYFSEDADGNRYNFLTAYYRNLPEMATNIFLKGYQWPFSANRAKDFGSSLVDIAVETELRAGRRVFMDFMVNPSYNDEVFDIDALLPEAKQYLIASGALQATPYERLMHMNPASIDIYTENGVDLHEPLEIAVSFQHNNGGLRIDNLYQTNITNLFAIGEVAGSHGVARPGGSALNSGQVGGTRVSQYIKSRKSSAIPSEAEGVLVETAAKAFQETCSMLGEGGRNHWSVRSEVQDRMTSSCGFVREQETVKTALSAANVDGYIDLRAKDNSDLPLAWETKNLCIAHKAYLASIDRYISDGGGSRGSYLVKDSGTDTIPVQNSDTVLFAYRKERLDDRKIRVKVHGPNMNTSIEEVRPLPEDNSWFETTWADYLSGRIWEKGE